jgi:hypothetical protein
MKRRDHGDTRNDDRSLAERPQNDPPVPYDYFASTQELAIWLGETS